VNESQGSQSNILRVKEGAATGWTVWNRWRGGRWGGKKSEVWMTGKWL